MKRAIISILSTILLQALYAPDALPASACYRPGWPEGFYQAGKYTDQAFMTGFVFPVRHNLQFDISGGLGINKNSPVGLGSFGHALISNDKAI